MSIEGSTTTPPIEKDFGRTRWSMVAAVRKSSESDARRSLGELCRRYWVPVYLFVRRSEYSPDDAAWLVQSFLSQLVAQLRDSEPSLATGFRAYLQLRLEAFLATDVATIAAIDILPGTESPWPLEEIERRHRDEHSANATPANAMQRGFALELLAIALARLKHEAEQSGRADLFAAVRPFLSREPASNDYTALAERVQSSPLAMVIAVKRLRQRFQQIVDEELTETIGNVEALEHERQTLLSLVAPSHHHE